MLLIAGSSHPNLAQSIASKLSVPLILANIKKFDDQELQVEIEADFKDQEVVIIQSTSTPVNDHLIELLFISHKAQAEGAKQITAVIPYFGYSRQDKSLNGLTPIDLIGQLLKTAGVNKVITLDLHNQNTEKEFIIDIQNLDSTPLVTPLVRNLDNLVIVTPDLGGIERVKRLANALEVEYAVINKKRASKGKYSMEKVQGEVKGKNCLIIDDIIDSGGTLINAAKLLKEEKAQSVTVYITHAVFSKKSYFFLNFKMFENFYTTNSIDKKNLPPFVQVIQIEALIAGALKKTLTN